MVIVERVRSPGSLGAGCQVDASLTFLSRGSSVGRVVNTPDFVTSFDDVLRMGTLCLPALLLAAAQLDGSVFVAVGGVTRMWWM